MDQTIVFQIQRGWIRDLDTAEFPQLVISSCNTIGETFNNIDDVALLSAYDNLKSQLSGMELLRLYVRMQDLTEQVSEEDAKRRTLVSMITNHVKNRLKSYDDLEAAQAKVLYRWIKGVASNLPYYSRNRLTRYIDILLKDSESKEDIEDAISSLGQTKDFIKLREVNSRFESLKLENDLLFINKNLSSKQKNDLRLKAYTALKYFISTLDSCMYFHGEEKYRDLYLALKKNLEDFHTALKMRRKKKSEINLNGEIVDVNAKTKSILVNTVSVSDSNSATSDKIGNKTDIASDANNDVNSEAIA